MLVIISKRVIETGTGMKDSLIDCNALALFFLDLISV